MNSLVCVVLGVCGLGVGLRVYAYRHGKARGREVVGRHYQPPEFEEIVASHKDSVPYHRVNNLVLRLPALAAQQGSQDVTYQPPSPPATRSGKY